MGALGNATGARLVLELVCVHIIRRTCFAFTGLGYGVEYFLISVVEVHLTLVLWLLAYVRHVCIVASKRLGCVSDLTCHKTLHASGQIRDRGKIYLTYLVQVACYLAAMLKLAERVALIWRLATLYKR